MYVYIYVLFLIKIEENGRILNRRRAGHLPIMKLQGIKNQESRKRLGIKLISYQILKIHKSGLDNRQQISINK
jgi:hypothetical protein